MLGETLALCAALTWSVSVILFKRSEAISPQGMNLFKNVVALVLLLLTMPVMGVEVDWDRSRLDWIILATSGVLGLAIADTFIFVALRRLGAARLAVVDCAYAPVTVGASIIFLADPVGVAFAFGAALVIGGVLIVSSERADKLASASDRRLVVTGVIFGLAGICLMAMGVVLVKPILETSSLVEVTMLRLFFGVSGQFLWAAAIPSERIALSALRPSRAWKTLLPAAVLGSYISMLMWLGGFKYTSVSTASLLNQMSTVFTIVLARVVLGEHLSRRRIAGGLLAISGAIVIMKA